MTYIEVFYGFVKLGHMDYMRRFLIKIASLRHSFYDFLEQIEDAVFCFSLFGDYLL